MKNAHFPPSQHVICGHMGTHTLINNLFIETGETEVVR